MKQGLCLECGLAGHFAASCLGLGTQGPAKKAPEKRRANTPMKKSASRPKSQKALQASVLEEDPNHQVRRRISRRETHRTSSKRHGVAGPDPRGAKTGERIPLPLFCDCDCPEPGAGYSCTDMSSYRFGLWQRLNQPLTCNGVGSKSSLASRPHCVYANGWVGYERPL